MNYKETLQLEELKIANDKFDFERCESENLLLKGSNRQKHRA